MQPRTRGPEAHETKTINTRACGRQNGGSTVHNASCAAAFSVRSSPLSADTVYKSRNSFADALFTQGLMALMPPTIWCVRAQSMYASL